MTRASGFAALAFLLSVSGCGGGNEPAPLTKAAFIRRADAICTKADERFQLLYERYVRRTKLDLAKKRTTAIWREIVQQAFAPSVDGELAELGDLGAPKGDGATVRAILAARRRGLREVEANPDDMVNTEEEFKRSHALAQAFGLEVCGY